MSDNPLGGDRCLLCNEEFTIDDHAIPMPFATKRPDSDEPTSTMRATHRECMLRSVAGGIGHLEDHAHWCLKMHDPDGGRTYRQSALEVDEWIARNGVDAAFSYCDAAGVLQPERRVDEADDDRTTQA